MTTAEEIWALSGQPDAEQPALPAPIRPRDRWRAGRRALARLAGRVVALLPDRFTASQAVGGVVAAGGSYLLWGLGVTLFTAGLAVVAVSWHIEGKR